MAKAIFDNLTPAQAKTFVDWFEGQGEQDCGIWFEDNCVDEQPWVDCQRKYVVDEDGSVTAFCKTYDKN